MLRASKLCKFTILALVLAGQAWAFPMKPDIKLMLEQAQRPRPHYVPARAGWNGPEEKPAAAPNQTYDELRREPSPAELRQQLLTAAVPDWRAALAIVVLISVWRTSLRGARPKRLVPVLGFRVTVADVGQPPDVAEAA